MKRRPVFMRYFECEECKERTTAPKKANKKTSEGHIKTMWCWKCKDVKNFVQLRYV